MTNVVTESKSIEIESIEAFKAIGINPENIISRTVVECCCCGNVIEQQLQDGYKSYWIGGDREVHEGKIGVYIVKDENRQGI